MYFADLSPCRYYGLSVGWLEKGHDFPRGQAPPGFLEHLLERCRRPEIRRRGLHLCEFCPSPVRAQAASIRELANGERVMLGGAAIRVHPRHGLAFVAPTLVYHYVEAHKYLPPPAFMEAVMEDNPENAETAAARNRHGAHFLGRMLQGWLYANAMSSAPPGQNPTSKAPGQNCSTWTVWRQDDSGNRFLIETNLTEAQARAMVADFEARGHKQTYWCSEGRINAAPER